MCGRVCCLMGVPERSLSDLIEKVTTWIRGDLRGISREFWMPDGSCRMCYECDSHFTLFNRRHHCRSCGRLFCGKCMQNDGGGSNDGEQVKFCKFCFQAIGQEAMTEEFDHRLDLPLRMQAFGHDDDKLDSCRSFRSESLTGFLEAQQGFSLPHAVASSCTASSVDPLSLVSLHCPAIRSDEEDVEDAGPVALSSSGSPSLMTSSPSRVYESPLYWRGRSPISQNDALLHQESVGVLRSPEMDSKDRENTDDCTDHLPIFQNQCQKAQEPLDFENNGLIWFPPPPDDEEDDVEDSFFESDDEDDNVGKAGMIFSSSSFSSESFPSRERSNEGQKEPLRAVVRGHFRALVSQLLKGEGIYAGNEDKGRGWLEIVASLAWQAANFVRPDTTRGGSMDPVDYVKVKCVVCGSPSESTLVKGVVCTKNIKHKRMTSQYRNPKLLLLGGSLEYQRVPNMLASFDTLLQQEIEHLKMTVAKIEAHRPNVLLVEKSVSSYAQEYLLEKEISLVLNVKRPLLECISRCTGANIVPSIDKLASTRLGHCESFRLERVSEECASAERPNKRSTKTLMFFEGCPKRLGCTVILRGTSRDELKKVKHVVQYAVFAAYHLSLETSFLADEGASLPKMPPKSPIVTLDNPVNAYSGISMIPHQVMPTSCPKIEYDRVSTGDKLGNLRSVSLISTQNEGSLLIGSGPKDRESSSEHYDPGPVSAIFPASVVSDLRPASSAQASADMALYGGLRSDPSMLSADVSAHAETVILESPVEEGAAGNFMQPAVTHEQTEAHKFDANEVSSEYFSAADNHQSILVSLSSRCVLKGTVCERSQLFRIKFYGSFDKPLGRFLRDDLFDQRSCCRTCNEPAEAHVSCYTHQQGSLTISVRRLSSLKLSGERDGKIWMWHRCLKCAREDGVPPATRRVVMSDAAWGLSFGKFLELSFSNHATANRVATCGHSLQKDCLRYYGFGSMVAFFRYSPIEILSVNLPPSMLEFNSLIQQAWLKREASEVSKKRELFYAEVFDVLRSIEQRVASFGYEPSGMSDFCDYITELKEMLTKERIEYDGLLQPATIENWPPCLPAVTILHLNHLRCCLLIDTYTWDRHLHLLDSFFKLRRPISRSDPFLPVNAILAKLKDWRHESFLKDAQLGCTPEENSMKSSTLLDNPEDFIMLKEDGDPNIQSLEPSSNEIIRKDLSLMSVEAYMGPESLESSSDHRKECNEGHLDGEDPIGRTTSESLPSTGSNLSDKIDLAWTGTGQSVKPQFLHGSQSDGWDSSAVGSVSQIENVTLRKVISPMRVYSFDSALRFQEKIRRGSSSTASMHLFAAKSFHASGDFSSMVYDPIPNLPRTHSPLTSPRATQILNFIYGYTPGFISSTFRMVSEEVRLLLPQMGHSNIVIAIYDNEPTSVISYALSSRKYQNFITDRLDELGWNENDGAREDDPSIFTGYLSGVSLSVLQSFSSQDLDDIQSRSVGSDEVSSSRGNLFSDSKKSPHVRVSFADESSSPAGKVKFSVTCYFAKQFDALRKKCCPSEVDFLCSLSRCRRWSAQGGKSNVYFAKTLDERFIIKQVTKTELESFEEFAPGYFKHLMNSLSSGSPTCLAKVLGIYQVTVKHLKGGKDIKMDLMVMENLFFGRNISRVYDLKGSARARYNPDTTGNNKVLLDLNLLEALRTKPIFVGSKAKRNLERAIWNDTSFLASVDVMDYSLLVGVDEERKELVLGIIDFMRQYTWDKHLETWVKASGILGGPINESPTVISPDLYKKRFRKAMKTYFFTVPDQWSS